MEKELEKYVEEILSIPSPSGYSKEITNYLKDIFSNLDVAYTEINKGGIIVTLKGENDEYGKTISAHADTLGAMVKEIKKNGKLTISRIGGYMMNTVEGENCVIITNSSKKYTGTCQTIKPSVHIYGDEAYKLKRDLDTMEIVIDEKVSNDDDVKKLGINVGDFIAFDTRTIITESGFVKSRYLDDKASVAILLYVIGELKKVKLKNTVNFFFSVYEEVGHGAKASIPSNTKEFLAIDMGAPGDGQNSSEYEVCICAKDSSGPYDYEMKLRLIQLCESNKIKYKLDVYPFYGSDASAAIGAGYDIKTGLIGPGIFASHGYERTHLDTMVETIKLIISYCNE